MIATILTIIAYILPLIIEGLRTEREKSKGHDHDTNIQQFRAALNSTPPTPPIPLFTKEGERGGVKEGVPTGGGVGVDAALADQHDRVLPEVRGS